MKTLVTVALVTRLIMSIIVSLCVGTFFGFFLLRLMFDISADAKDKTKVVGHIA